MRVIIAGGRDYVVRAGDFGWLDDLRNRYWRHGIDFEEVVHGDQTGADTMGKEWARSRNIPVLPFPAEWQVHGKAAGPIRNRAMAEYAGKDGLCVIFPGGKGTAIMIAEAGKVGMTVVAKIDGDGRVLYGNLPPLVVEVEVPREDDWEYQE